ncbi:glycosyltransferase family 2 protein [Pirellulaceae bacterium SH501]
MTEPNDDLKQEPLLELSVVMPCLNEADTVATCVQKALATMRKHGIQGEVIVADNGSSDGSVDLAIREGARVVNIERRGYGAALMGGIAAARGRFVLMGDADDSYDFTTLPMFYEKLLAGADLVQGCRLPSGGGTVMPGAMPPLHRWLGNPLLTKLVQWMFKTKIQDVYCGLRAFRKTWQEELEQRCTGMEFATEMIIKSALFGGRVEQVPVTLHPDGRIHQRSHLRTFRDGWRTLRFFLLLCPRWTFFIPGFAVGLAGFLLGALALPQTKWMGIALDVHTLLVGVLAILVGSQWIWCGVLAKTFAISEGILPSHHASHSSTRKNDSGEASQLERLLLIAAAMATLGFALVGGTAWDWYRSDFGPLEYATTMRRVIPGVGLIAMAAQFAASSFLLSVLRLSRL